MAKTPLSEKIPVRCDADFKISVEEFAKHLGISVSALVRMSVTEKMDRSKWHKKEKALS